MKATFAFWLLVRFSDGRQWALRVQKREKSQGRYGLRSLPALPGFSIICVPVTDIRALSDDSFS